MTDIITGRNLAGSDFCNTLTHIKFSYMFLKELVIDYNSIVLFTKEHSLRYVR